ncbi:unnamed protein product [Boreogadus saida]
MRTMDINHRHLFSNNAPMRILLEGDLSKAQPLTRSDRDKYVRINWRNINRRNAHNFKKQNTNNLNTPYDYTSIMHYGRTAFSINGRDNHHPPSQTPGFGLARVRE